MEIWLPLISEYGFPVMITLYLLYRIEAKLDLLNDSVAQLAVILQGNTLVDESKKQFKFKA
ncbi:YvrJ family protein [Anaerobacillus sp. CMMVII]|uniref:YvrJ family protein n=1 Tax=Anaerobacillus sp. CMMVII TaxID=2755588 RepID=UPI0021B78FA0|nr:YvrJ family protein [Anaerobacillus sp. CMMVII]MCT8137588.1 YvrJ family protein [Anaerobacillus sp. CMMVII]